MSQRNNMQRIAELRRRAAFLRHRIAEGRGGEPIEAELDAVEWAVLHLGEPVMARRLLLTLWKAVKGGDPLPPELASRVRAFLGSGDL